jgi:hypothetical protein
MAMYIVAMTAQNTKPLLDFMILFIFFWMVSSAVWLCP